MPGHLNFCRQREQEERELASKASDPWVKVIHLELAEAYVQLSGISPILPGSEGEVATGELPSKPNAPRMSREVATVERDAAASDAESSRALIRAAVQRRYTAPSSS